MLRRSMVLIAIVTLFMVVAAPALAGAPQTNPWSTYEFEWDYGLDEDLSDACGFEVFTSGKVSQVEKVFFNRDGLFNRFEVHAKGNIDTYAPEFGTSLKVKWAVHISERRITGTDEWDQTWTGTGWNIHEPGSGGGAVLHDRGRVTLLWQAFDWMLNPPISWSGHRDHHDVLLNHVDSTQAKCDALTP